MSRLDVTQNETLREKIYYTRLASGLEVFVLPKFGFNKKYATFATRYGSIDSKFQVGDTDEVIEVPDGIAHFLEHKLFEEEDGNIDEKFAELGAYSNAFTNYTMTAYLTAATDTFDEALDTLVRFVQRPYFTDENVEKEKGIIEQEIRMYEDSPGWRVYNNLLEALYSVHPVRKDIAGTVESIRRIDKEVLYKCYRTFYHPSNMSIFVCGDLDPQKVVELIEKASSEAKGFGPPHEIRRIMPEEPKEVNKPKATQDLVVSRPLFSLGYKDTRVGFSGRKLLEKQVVTEILLDMLMSKSSELFNQLYEEGLIDDSFHAEYECQPSYGHTVFSGETRDPDKLYGRLLSGIEEFKRTGLVEESFERTKKKVIGAFLSGFNSLEFIAHNYLAYHFKEADLMDYLEVAQEMTLDQVARRAEEHFDLGFHAVSVIMPKS